MPKKNQTNQTNQEMLTRQFSLEYNAIVDEDSRLVRLSFSSEEPYTRQPMFSDAWVEVLGHEIAEANLTRLNNSGIVFYNHRGERIGVIERAWIESKRGFAEIRFSKRSSEDIEGIWQDVKDGILRNVSVAYKILKRELIEQREDKPDIYRVTEWEPHEVSLVDIPADPTVGVGRSAEDEDLTPTPNHPPKLNQKEKQAMPEKVVEKNTEQTETAAPTTPSVDADALRQETLTAEKERRTEIRSLFTEHEGFDDTPDKMPG